MPVVTVTYDAALDERLARHIDSLAEQMVVELVAGMKAAVDDCQIMFVPASRVAAAYPVYLRLEFRAAPHRPVEVVQQVLQRLGDLLGDCFESSVRLRGFAIDQATLSAVNLQRQAGVTDA